ncbi:hypothetical protein [Paralcaligenes ginsengisoli]
MEMMTLVEDTAAMTEEEIECLLEQAKELARHTFERPGREHVLGVYRRLLWNHEHGLDDAGATTLH